MSLLEKIKAGKRHARVIKFPGSDEDVALQVLSNHDIQEAVFAAENLFKRAGMEITGSTMDAYEDERTTQILFRALRDPADPKKPFASNVDELRKGLTKAEKEVLVREYYDHERECSPDFAHIPDEEFEEIWAELKKNPQTLSSVSSSTMLRGLLTYLASLPSNSPTDSGFTSSS